MKAKDLISVLQRHEEDDLEILVSSPSVGYRATSKVKHVQVGFDWERGKILIAPEDALVVKKTNEKVFDMSYDFLIKLTLDGRHSKKGFKYSYIAEHAKEILLNSGVSEEFINRWRKDFTR